MDRPCTRRKTGSFLDLQKDVVAGMAKIMRLEREVGIRPCILGHFRDFHLCPKCSGKPLKYSKEGMI